MRNRSGVGRGAAEFPDMKGSSVTNLKCCIRFYGLYNQSDIIRQQVVEELKVSVFSKPWGGSVLAIDNTRRTCDHSKL